MLNRGQLQLCSPFDIMISKSESWWHSSSQSFEVARLMRHIGLHVYAAEQGAYFGIAADVITDVMSDVKRSVSVRTFKLFSYFDFFFIRIIKPKDQRPKTKDTA